MNEVHYFRNDIHQSTPTTPPSKNTNVAFLCRRIFRLTIEFLIELLRKMLFISISVPEESSMLRYRCESSKTRFSIAVFQNEQVFFIFLKIKKEKKKNTIFSENF